MWGYRCRCVITGNGGTSYAHLGRPWGPFGRVVFAYTYMDACIKHVGWNNWGKTENERSACFYEYRLALFIPSPHISAAVRELLFRSDIMLSLPLLDLCICFGYYQLCSQNILHKNMENWPFMFDAFNSFMINFVVSNVLI